MPRRGDKPREPRPGVYRPGQRPVNTRKEFTGLINKTGHSTKLSAGLLKSMNGIHLFRASSNRIHERARWPLISPRKTRAVKSPLAAAPDCQKSHLWRQKVRMESVQNVFVSTEFRL